MSKYRPLEQRGGMPAEFYVFALGSTVLGRWTSGPVWFGDSIQNYRPVTIRHEVIEASEERTAGALRVILPADQSTTNDVVDLYRGTVPTGVVTLQLLRKHQGSRAFPVIFAGEVSAAEFTASECILTVEPKVHALKQRVLRQLYQGPCNNTLYDTFCGVHQPSFTTAGTVTAIASDNVTLTIAEAALQADDYYTGGVLTFGSRRGFIIAHTGSTITLLRPVDGLAVSSSVSISAGCDRQIATCETKFNNITQHMGFPFIPSVDPFTQGVDVTDP